MKNKKSFVMMEDWTVLLAKLPEQEAGRLIKAMCEYQLTGILDESDPVVAAMMAMITPVMDANNDKHEEVCQKRSEIGKQGVAKRWQKDSKPVANDSKPIANDSNCYSDDSKALQTIADSESDSEYEYPTDTTIPPTPLPELTGMSDPMKDKLREWLQYKKERRESYKPTGMKSLITQVGRRERELGTPAALSCIDTAMSNGWKGIQWEKARSGTTNRFSSGMVRADYSGIREEDLIAN